LNDKFYTFTFARLHLSLSLARLEKLNVIDVHFLPLPLPVPLYLYLHLHSLKHSTHKALGKENYLPPIPFCMIFNYQAYEIVKLLKTLRIQVQSNSYYHKSQIVSAYKHNCNLKDLLAKSKLK
jgi:hypothetical protein